MNLLKLNQRSHIAISDGEKVDKIVFAYLQLDTLVHAYNIIYSKMANSYWSMHIRTCTRDGKWINFIPPPPQILACV